MEGLLERRTGNLANADHLVIQYDQRAAKRRRDKTARREKAVQEKTGEAL
jgi:hypothetical protein